MKTLLKECFRFVAIVSAAFLLLAASLQTAKAADCADNDMQCWVLAAKAQWRTEQGEFQQNFDTLRADMRDYILQQAQKIQEAKNGKSETN